MPVEAKPLFRPDVLRPHLQAFQLPPSVDSSRDMLRHWSELLSPDNPAQLGERQLLPDFLTAVFGGLLGYTLPASGDDHYTLSREQYVQVDGKWADAVLGRFEAEQTHFIVAVEGKGPLDPLERPFAGRRYSAVDQGYGYAINLPCDWIVVTSMRQTRLYYKNADQQTYERFDIDKLANDETTLKRFVFILGASRVVPATGRCHLYSLYDASERVGRDLTKEFYQRYANMRQEAFELLCAANPAVSRTDVLNCTQKLLDRILFIAFCEDRGLMPVDSIKLAFEHRDPYHPRPVADNFRGLFHSINVGSPALDISPYNGGLFAVDQQLDSLTIPDAVCTHFRDLGDYDYRPASEVAVSVETEQARRVIDVEILGHIFEQSITDLEVLRNELEGLTPPVGPDKHKTRRKKEGAFYTPAFITRYIVEQALGGVLRGRFEGLRKSHAEAAKGTARAALIDPSVYDLEALKNPQREALVRFWETWQDELETIRVLDPACGSGAFLIEAFDQLHAAYQASNDRLHELRGHRTLYDLDRRILQHNLYGVDINEEAIDICKLSLWIKTAAYGKKLTSLDHSIRVGNSVVDDPQLHAKAFSWQEAFPEVFDAGGFDVVIGNPPYVRQEWIKRYKAYWSGRFKTFSGTADVYIYFFEIGLSLLRGNGRLGFVTSGTFARAAFAEPFRHWLPTVARFQNLVNFGENQPFEGAEMVYPTISILRKATVPCEFPALFIREKIPASLNEAMTGEGVICSDHVFEQSEWRFQRRDVSDLFQRLMHVGKRLLEAVGGNIYRGVLTGLNEAFIVDHATRDGLVNADPGCNAIIKKMLRGEDLRPWYYEDEGRWLIFIPNGRTSSECGSRDESAGWKWLQKAYPSVAAYLEPFERRARARADKGEFWWELRPCDYYDAFERPKIMWPDIAKLPRFAWDSAGCFTNNKIYLIPVESPFLLGVLQSRVSWFCISQICTPLRLRGGLWQFQCFKQFIERLPIPTVGQAERKAIEALAADAISLTRERYNHHEAVRRRIADDLGEESGGALAGRNRLFAWWKLDFSAFRREVKRQFGQDIPVRERQEWDGALSEWQSRHGELTAALLDAETELNERIYKAFGLSTAEREILEDHARHAMIDYNYGES